jgi:putative ABC transport system permease protein
VTRLPLLARVLLRLTDPAVREFVAGDLEETFAARAAREGPRGARRWVLRQSLAAVAAHPWKPGPRHTGDGFMRTLLQDLRYGVRMIRHQPGFSGVVIMTLALAIGANTVIFSFANTLLLRPLPMKDQVSLGWIFSVDPHRGGNRGKLSIPEFMDYRESLSSFASLAATTAGYATLTGRGDARRLATMQVTANLIDVWGLRMHAGRSFSPGADTPGAPGEVVISHHYWNRELNRDPSIVGQVLMLDGKPATVIGVLGPEIDIGGWSEIDLWVPLVLAKDAPRADRTLRGTGRLKPGVTHAQADAEVRRFAQVLARDHPKASEGWGGRVTVTRDAIIGGDTWPVLTMLSLVVGFVLLLACANLANLVLSRATGRRRELAVRSALGASRGRVVRQMLTENLIYGVFGATLAVAIAHGGLLAMSAAAYEPVFHMVRIDRNVLVFAAVLAVLTPVLFALLPALQSTRADSGDALKDGGTRAAGGVHAARSRSILVVTQLGLAVMLLVVSTLLVQALVIMARLPLGVDSRRILTARLDLPEWRYSTPAAIADYHDHLLARLRAMPAIENAALTDRMPQLDGEPTTVVTIEGRTAPRTEDRPWAVPATVSDAFFESAGISIVAGRAFVGEDRPGRVPVAVINAEMARRYWGVPERALGARFSLVGDASEPFHVVGVASDVLRADREGVNPQVYLSLRQRPGRAVSLVVRAADPSGAAPSVREQLRGLDADVPVSRMRAFQQALDEDLSSSRILGSMFVSFALLALILAASGLYAVVSYTAAQRGKEFGVRIALGATTSDIVTMMLKQTGKLVAIGLVLGLIGGRALAMVATSLLYGVSPSDPATYTAVAVTLGSIALLASYIPVRRATAVDPVSALRLE